MAIMTHTKFHFNWLMLTLIFGIRASEPPPPPRTTEKAEPDRVKVSDQQLIDPLFFVKNIVEGVEGGGGGEGG